VSAETGTVWQGPEGPIDWPDLGAIGPPDIELAANNGTQHTAVNSRTVDGWEFVSQATQKVLARWGRDDLVLWAEGEPLMLVGPDGVGKTSLLQQLGLARVRGSSDLLGFPVEASSGRVLYLAADRPSQGARSMRRMVSDTDEEILRERLIVHRGALPFDIVTTPPGTLREFVQGLGASDLFVDSLKDIAVGLASDEVGAAVNLAFQELSAAGIELVVAHHQRKQMNGGRPPEHLADVYGSRWLTAGMGSVALLWGDAGDLIVRFKHLKQPAEEVGPFDVLHDHVRGHTTLHNHIDLEELLAASTHGLTVKDTARLLFAGEEPKPNDVEKARRRLESLIGRNRAERRDDPDGLARYFTKEAP
jgi:replicative DNA helicase